jgi:DNA-binding transcriptional ArsR family regulator
MDTFAALADPTRRRILELLARDGPTTASQIVAHFRLTPPAISQHLKVLREAQLVQMDKRAQQRVYRINPAALRDVEDWASRLTQLWNRRFDAFEQVLEAEKSKRQAPSSERNSDDPIERDDRS